MVDRFHSVPKNATLGDLKPIREELEDAIAFAMGAGGQAKEIANRGDKLRDRLIETFRKSLVNDPKGTDALEKANDYYDEVSRPFNLPIIAHIRKDGPIPSEDIFATILSEEPDMIAIVMRVLPANVTKPMAEECLRLMARRREEGLDDPDYYKKVDILLAGIKRHDTDSAGPQASGFQH